MPVHRGQVLLAAGCIQPSDSFSKSMATDERSPGPRRRGAENVLAALRAELGRLRDGLERVEENLGRLEREEPQSRARARPERYYEVLLDLYEHGRHGLDAEAFGRLGEVRGYDARGLGGFFVGSRAPLRRVERRVVLTPEGHRLLDEHLGRRATP